MHDTFLKIVRIRFSWVILLLVVIAAVALIVTYYRYPLDPKDAALVAGLTTGLMIFIVQFLLSWNDHLAYEKFHALRIEKILDHREDRKFYENLIKTSQSKVDVMGVTASRFLEHFADINSGLPETRVLIDALERGVKVRILVARETYLEGSEKLNCQKSAVMLGNLSDQNKDFQYRYFDHAPAHGVMVVDDKCIVGPVFPDVPSKYTPAIYLSVHSRFAKKYLAYLESEWGKASV